MKRQPHPRWRLWLINKLAANHSPINIPNKFAHVMEDLPVPLCSQSQRMRIGPQGARQSVWPHWPKSLVYRELAAQGSQLHLPGRTSSPSRQPMPHPPQALGVLFQFPKFLLHSPVLPNLTFWVSKVRVMVAMPGPPKLPRSTQDLNMKGEQCVVLNNQRG